MPIYLIGLSHRSAPIETREQLSFSNKELKAALCNLIHRPEVDEAALLHTCNRTELYLSSLHRLTDDQLALLLCLMRPKAMSQVRDHLYYGKDTEAVVHLFEVAAGIDSMVIGEYQILGQVKAAYDTAGSCNTIGAIIHALFRQAIVTGKRARTETEIGKGGFSVGHAAVELASSIFGSLAGKAVLILGAGKMSEITARHLVSEGAPFVVVANRTYERAQELAGKLGGQAIQYQDFHRAIETADIIISSTAAPHPILRREDLAPIIRKRRGRSLFLIDIAMPRDIERSVETLDNVFLYDIDDLQDVVAESAQQRQAEVEKVKQIIQEEAAKFTEWFRIREAAPLLSRLKKHVNEIQEAELNRLRGQLGEIGEAQWRAIEAATRSMVRQVVRHPIVRIKQEFAQSNGKYPEYNLLDAAEEIFGLEEPSVEGNQSASDETTEESH
ncbi:MAG: glutamyl-tRNA reductase [Armatimonadetes bacterium]|nr:glutamyl-tRNA reductase [Armatimonadota bacterium]